MFNTYNKQTITNNTLTHFSKLIIHFSIFSNMFSPSLSPPVLSSSSSSRDYLLTAIAKRCEIEPPPHTPMRRNTKIFHSPTIASAGRARMRGRHYRCKQSKTEETGNLPHPLSNSNIYPFSILSS